MNRLSKRQYLSFGVLAVLFVGILFVVRVAQRPQEIRQQAALTFNGYYKIINKKSGKLVAVGSSSLADGAKVIQWPNTNNTDQQWTFTSMGGGYYKIFNKNSNKVMALEGVTTENAQDIQWGSDSYLDQQWSPQHVGGGYVKFFNKEPINKDAFRFISDDKSTNVGNGS